MVTPVGKVTGVHLLYSHITKTKNEKALNNFNSKDIKGGYYDKRSVLR